MTCMLLIYWPLRLLFYAYSLSKNDIHAFDLCQRINFWARTRMTFTLLTYLPLSVSFLPPAQLHLLSTHSSWIFLPSRIYLMLDLKTGPAYRPRSVISTTFFHQQMLHILALLLSSDMCPKASLKNHVLSSTPCFVISKHCIYLLCSSLQICALRPVKKMQRISTLSPLRPSSLPMKLTNTTTPKQSTFRTQKKKKITTKTVISKCCT